MVSWKILAGGYDTYVATYLLTIAPALTVDIRLLSKSPTGTNPSWLAQHPTDKSLLYATNEGANGALQSFRIYANGSLSTALDTISTAGADPAHVVALPNGKVAVMNYSSGNGKIIKTSQGGTKFDVSSPVITFAVPAGTQSHPHQTVQYGDALLIPDLGADKIWRVQQSAGDKVVFGQAIPQPKGSGPRHVSVSGDRLFTLHELSSTLTVQALPALDATNSAAIFNTSIIPAGAPAGAKWAAAEILIPPPSQIFPKSYIYVSNRNLGTLDPRGDTIAIFEHVNKGTAREALVLVNQVYTGLNQVRGMQFGPPESGGDEYLVASGVAGSGGVVVLKRVDGGRNLVIVAKNLAIPTRTTFVWV